MGDDIGGKMGQEAVAQRLLAIVVRGIEHAQSNLPVVTVVKILGEVLADDDVGRAAAVKIIVGIAAQKLAHERCQDGGVLEDLQPEVDMGGGSPSEGQAGCQQHDNERVAN